METTNYWEKNYHTKTFPDVSLDNSTYLDAVSSIQIQNHKITITRPNGTKMSGGQGGGKRQKINGFSRQSRRRCLLKLATVDFSAYKTKFFSTFTFRNEYPETKEGLKSLLILLLKRIERIPFVSCIFWRVEYQKRGAPHIHLLILIKEKLNSKDVIKCGKMQKKAWGELTASLNQMSFTRGSEIIEIRGDEKVYFYLSKYVAKVENNDKNKRLGRVWGVRGEVVKQNILDENVPEEIINRFIELYKNSLSAKFPLDEHFEFYLCNAESVTLLIPSIHLRLIFKLIMKEKPFWQPSGRLKNLLNL